MSAKIVMRRHNRTGLDEEGKLEQREIEKTQIEREKWEGRGRKWGSVGEGNVWEDIYKEALRCYFCNFRECSPTCKKHSLAIKPKINTALLQHGLIIL